MKRAMLPLSEFESEAFWSKLFGTPPTASPNLLGVKRDQSAYRVRATDAIQQYHATCIQRLHDEGIPLVFLYVLASIWNTGEQLCAALSLALQHRYAIANDAWAFRVAASEKGWSPHRGVYEPLSLSTPEVINAWIALTDVPREASCMWLVAPDDDPEYPTGPATNAALVKGLPYPMAAGEALLWNANTLHWGGASAANAPTRLSYTFTLVREGSHASLARMPPAPTFRERLNCIAQQICTYQAHEPLHPHYLNWAKLTLRLQQ
jgi:hypothetical protein